MSTPIEKFYQHVDPKQVRRVQSAMELEKIKTIEDLCTWNDRPLWDPKSLCRIRNTGPKTIHAIKEALGQLGLSLDRQGPPTPVNFGGLRADTLTTRDVFALAALHGLLAHDGLDLHSGQNVGQFCDATGTYAYFLADAMLEARKA